MSFILDALRKSEAARRRSESPDLFATLPQTSAPARSRVAWPLWAMAGFGAVSSALALWLLLHRPEPPATAAAPIASADGAPIVDAADTGIERDAAVDAPPAADAAEPSAPMTATTTPPVPPVPPVPKPVPAPVTATTPAPVASTAPPAAVPAPPTVTPTPAPAPPPATGDRATALADLDPDVRRQLPALKLSMQVWNEDPQRRFVILDGQRLREGDRAGDVVVERINRTDVLLSWRGARLRLPAE